jgi:hypothetical protein
MINHPIANKFNIINSNIYMALHVSAFGTIFRGSKIKWTFFTIIENPSIIISYTVVNYNIG